jgi:hypothetical protein
MNWNKPQSGTLAVDYYREGRGLAAANVLTAGKAVLCVSGDHATANELCVEVIARKGTDPAKCASDSAHLKTVTDAIHNLRAGNGFHKKQSDHSGSNTCAAVIAAATG